MIDTKTLSIKDKISLLNELYEELSGHGVGGDTELAHINPWEADLLRSVGGAGTVNEVTGLRQYLGGGGSAPPPQPTQTTTRQVPEYAPEQREYVKDIFGKAQELYEQRTAEGFQPFPGAQLAPFAPQEQEAFRGIESLARGPGAAPAFEVARTAALGAAAPVTAAEIQQGMNPYQQAVTDIAKREAVRQYQRGPQAQLRSGAVEAGGLRGARRFIEEAEGQRDLQQRLSDIQTLGGQQAYNQAMAEAAAARGRLADLARQMPSIGTGAYQQQMAQLGQLGGVGEAQRAREQAAIDLAQSQFQRELMFPEETLATYLRFITNAPSPSGFQETTTKPGVPGPSTLTQLAGIGAGIGTLGKAFNVFNQGGRTSGLSGIVRRNRGGQIIRMRDGSSVADRILPYNPRGSSTGGIPPRRPEQMDAVGEFFSGLAGTIGDVGGDVIDYTVMKPYRKIMGQPDQDFEGDAYPVLLDEIGAGLSRDGQDYVAEDSSFVPEPYGLLGAENPPPASDEKVDTLTAQLQKILAGPTTTAPAATRPDAATDFANYMKFMKAGDEEKTEGFLSGLNKAELLNMAATFFGAANAPTTGSPVGDLAKFGAEVTPQIAASMSAADKRRLLRNKTARELRSGFLAYQKGLREEDREERRVGQGDAEVRIKQAKAFTDLIEAKANVTKADADLLRAKAENAAGRYVATGKADIDGAKQAIAIAFGVRPDDVANEAAYRVAQAAESAGKKGIPIEQAVEAAIIRGMLSREEGSWLPWSVDRVVLGQQTQPPSNVGFKVKQ